MSTRPAAAPSRVPKAAERVAAELRRQIIVGELTEDDTLPSEAELMRQFGVSRPTLREAYRILESERLISVRRGARGGARVHPPHGDVAAQYAGLVLQHGGALLSDVYEARVELEGPLGRLLTERRTPEAIARLHAELGAAADVLDDPQAYVERDAAFHLLVAELAGNQTMGVLVGMLWHIIRTANQAYLYAHSLEHDRAQAVHVQRSHERLVALVEAGDVAGAEEYWRHHVEEISRELLRGHQATTVVELLA